jgi:hypothetical protein
MQQELKLILFKSVFNLNLNRILVRLYKEALLIQYIFYSFKIEIYIKWLKIRSKYGK